MSTSIVILVEALFWIVEYIKILKVKKNDDYTKQIVFLFSCFIFTACFSIASLKFSKFNTNKMVMLNASLNYTIFFLKLWGLDNYPSSDMNKVEWIVQYQEQRTQIVNVLFANTVIIYQTFNLSLSQTHSFILVIYPLQAVVGYLG